MGNTINTSDLINIDGALHPKTIGYNFYELLIQIEHVINISDHRVIMLYSDEKWVFKSTHILGKKIKEGISK